jgi:hypothetical protein
MTENIVSFANGDFRNHKMVERQLLSMLTFCSLDNQNLQTLRIVVFPLKAPFSYLSCTLRTAMFTRKA